MVAHPKTGLYSGIPLGGIGAGSVELRADGLLHEWQIFNNKPWGSGPDCDRMERDGLIFGLVVRGAGKPRCMLLSEPHGFHPWLNDPYNLPWVEHPDSIEWQGRYPLAELSYTSDTFPVKTRMRAFSPFIPLDSRNSSIPAALFQVGLQNPGDKPLEVSVFCALKNSVLYEKEQNKSEMYFNGQGMVMSRVSDSEAESSFGSLAVMTNGGGVSWISDPAKPRQVWEPLMKTGRLKDFEEKKDSRFPYGVIARTVTVLPGHNQEMPFVLSWFFPNHYEADCGERGGRELIGHQYARWYNDAEEVASYVLSNEAYLATETMEFLDTFNNSTLEPWVLDAVNAQLTTLPKSSWWDKKGRFGIWEGLGCCGLQTMDITHYGSFPIALFFPDLQKSQMRLSVSNIEARGRIPHMMPGAFSCSDKDEKGRIDLMPQFILLVWRDMLWMGDEEYLKEMMPAVKGALEFMKGHDTDGDGLPNNTGPDQTYDQFPLHGTSAFVGLLHIASLTAAAELAQRAGDNEFAQSCSEQVPGLIKEFEKQLFNGDYYNLAYDKAGEKLNTGCMLDQLNGEWFLRMAGHNGLLDRERVRGALQTMFELNAADSGYWSNCVWEREREATRIPLHITNQAGTPWSGVEYMFASHCIIEGLVDQGLAVTRAVFDRYERAGLRYNHIECGEHYYRALSSWAVFLALAGFGYDCSSKQLRFNSGLKKSRNLFNTPTSWGSVAVPPEQGGMFILDVYRGSLELKQILITGIRSAASEVSLNGCYLEFTSQDEGNACLLTLEQTAQLNMGSELTIEFT